MGGWMRRDWIICAAAVVLLLVLLNAIAAAQDTQEISSDPCEKKAGCVKSDYDRFKDRTTVTMTPILLVPKYGYGSPLEGVQMAVIYSSLGKVIQRPDKVLLLFAATDVYNSGQEPLAFRKSRDVDLLIDGVSQPLGAAEILRRKLNELDIASSTWTYSLEVPFDVIEKIAAAKRVEIRAGSVETLLDEETRVSFRHLIELTPKKEPAAPAAQKSVPPSVKRPKAARMPQRRKRP
jgi:hypothetical protein